MIELVSEIKWLVSDWHFGEPRMDLMCRPFRSTEEHDETLIRNHNRLVEPDDVVLCVGDVTYKKAPQHLESVGRMHGRKILIRGNHDEPHSDEALSEYFVTVVDDGDGIAFDYEGIPLYATHYPTQGREDRFNIVGHVHGLWRCQLNMLNVGVDNFGFAPCKIDRVPFFLNAITHFYDRDAWVAYETVNTKYRDTRGAKTRYFQ